VGPIIFARHAESESNARGMINGDPAIENPLSPRGLEQAARLRSELRGVSFDACFTTELLRTRRTAEVALSGRSVRIMELSDLNEPAAGEFEGGPVDTYNDWVVANGYWAANPGGESQVQALRRYVRAFHLMLDHGEQALVVAHALPIAWLREGIRARRDGVVDLRINVGDPGVDLATPQLFTRKEVARAADMLMMWLHDSPP
jgi:broad specificity phosphatase PhoE